MPRPASCGVPRWPTIAASASRNSGSATSARKAGTASRRISRSCAACRSPAARECPGPLPRRSVGATKTCAKPGSLWVTSRPAALSTNEHVRPDVETVNSEVGKSSAPHPGDRRFAGQSRYRRWNYSLSTGRHRLCTRCGGVFHTITGFPQGLWIAGLVGLPGAPRSPSEPDVARLVTVLVRVSGPSRSCSVRSRDRTGVAG